MALFRPSALSHTLTCCCAAQGSMKVDCQLRQTCSVCWIFDAQKWGLNKTYAVINSLYGFHSIHQGPLASNPVPLQGDAVLHPVRSYQSLGSRRRIRTSDIGHGPSSLPSHFVHMIDVLPEAKGCLSLNRKTEMRGQFARVVSLKPFISLQ